jgi:hypothetical protein
MAASLGDVVQSVNLEDLSWQRDILNFANSLVTMAVATGMRGLVVCKDTMGGGEALRKLQITLLLSVSSICIIFNIIARCNMQFMSKYMSVLSCFTSGLIIVLLFSAGATHVSFVIQF